MSRLKELIDELCPDGVEYQLVQDVAAIERGVRVVKKQLEPEARDDLFPVYQNSLIPLGFHNAANYKAETAFIIGAGGAGRIGYCMEDFWAADDCFPIVPDGSVHSKFLYYVLCNNQIKINGMVRQGTIPRIPRDDIGALTIPVPPIEVQLEIVRVLDSMQELDDALEAEIALRKEQWTFVRDALFDRHFGSPIANDKALPMVRLGDLYKVTSAKRVLADDQVPEGIPFMKVADLLTMIEGNEPHPESFITEEAYQELIDIDMVPLPGDILVTARGTLGRCYVVREDDQFYFQDGMVTWLRKTDASPVQSYFDSVFSNERFFERLVSNCSGSTVKYLSIKGLANTEVPLPTDEAQAAFDGEYQNARSVIELSERLEAEHALRRKQFEYYRDKLLDFPEKAVL